LLLEAVNLSVTYGSVNALKDVSFQIDRGEIIAMIGANGAGKSTALKAVSGLLGAFSGQIAEGEVFLEGKSIKHLRTDELAYLGMAIVPEGRRIFSSMTVRENLEMGAFTRNNRKLIAEDIDYVLTLFPQLKARANKRASVLSGGEQQMLAVGRALMLKPKLLLADEPSVGLSPNYIELIFEKFIEINQNGISVLLVEQNARMALEVCDRAYVFEVGKIAIDGTKNELINNERVKQVYLGIDPVTF
jgi:branched-chain amino acid transport system ATP-binding protein